MANLSRPTDALRNGGIYRSLKISDFLEGIVSIQKHRRLAACLLATAATLATTAVGIPTASAQTSEGDYTLTQVSDVSEYADTMVVVGDQAFFTAEDAATGWELWVTDGTPEGTNLVADINPGSDDSLPRYVTPFGDDRVVFSADDGVAGAELWISDGTEAGTTMVDDIYAGPPGSDPDGFVEHLGYVYFAARTAEHGRELWRSDGVTAQLWANVYPNVASSSPHNLSVLGNDLLFAAQDDGTGVAKFWKTHPASSGADPIIDFGGGSVGDPSEVVAFGATGVLAADVDGVGREFFATDGDTSIGIDLSVGASSSNPREFTVLGDQVVFAAENGPSGPQLWVSDVTIAGTELLVTLNDGPGGASPENLTVVGDLIYFTATGPTAGRELWMTDGTEPGTSRVADINPNGDSHPGAVVPFDGRLFFRAENDGAGSEIWSTDGTAAGTRLEADIFSGAMSSIPTNLAPLGDSLLFLANDGTNGRQVWKLSNGGCERALTGAYAGLSGSEGQIARLYVGVFGREPDSDGFAYWVGQRSSAAQTLDEMATFFVGFAPEFEEIYGSATSDAEYVTLLYQNILCREPDAGGLAFWLGELSGGMTRARVLLSLSDSPEFKEATGTS